MTPFRDRAARGYTVLDNICQHQSLSLNLMLQRELPVQKNNVVRVVGNKSLKKSGSFICSSDSEIIGYALDTLYNVISNDLEEEEQGKCSVVIVVLTVGVLSLVVLFKL